MNFLVPFLILASSSAFALPLPQQGEGPAQFAAPLSLASEVDFSAIVALSNCSGSLVRYVSSLGSDRAMVLTNGHCLGERTFLKPGEVRVNQTVSRSFKLLSRDARGDLGTLRADRILYATMTSTDMTLYRLTQTFDEIEKNHGIRALTLSSQKSTAGRRIHIASGYWRRMYSCTIDAFVHQLREDSWTFSDSIRYSEPGCDTIGGTSGSPIIDSETLEVIGVNNTSNENGAKCTMNNPCEVDESGAINAIKGSSYGQQTYWVYSCLDSKNELNLSREGCQLPR